MTERVAQFAATPQGTRPVSNFEVQGPVQTMSTDPAIAGGLQPQTPADFGVVWPQPLDPTEIIAMCEEVTMYNFLPEQTTGLKAHQWRERTELEYASGTLQTYIGFDDGDCPEPFQSAEGNTYTVNMKLIGAMDALHERDILHARAVSSIQGLGINRQLGPLPAGENMPGAGGQQTYGAFAVAGLKEKRMKEAQTLVLNGWDWLLVKGDKSANALVFDGLETLVSDSNPDGRSPHTNDNSSSGTFSAASFDRFLQEGCAKPQVIAGHPAAVQEMLSAYFQLGFQGSQVIQHSSGDRIVPGFNFASQVNTAIGTLPVVADTNFTRTDLTDGSYQTNLFPLRLTYFNGEQLIYKMTQIPLAFKDLDPGCTTIRFQIYASTALIVKDMCAQSRYTTQFTGRIVSTCPVVGAL